jgi:hypothetical protein
MIVTLRWCPEWIDLMEQLADEYEIEDDKLATEIGHQLMQDYLIDVDTETREVVSINYRLVKT